MRLVAYFLVPTLLGWVAGSATCLATMGVVGGTLPNPGEVTIILTIAGMFIVGPTYLLFVMPYSFLCRRYFREHKDRLPWWPLSVLLLACGGTLTFFPLSSMLGANVVDLASDLPAENPALFLVPFIPYSLVVAWLVSRLTAWSFRYDDNNANPPNAV